MIPKLSIIIPNYNHGNYLSQRIQSVLDQTFTDFELIILDDASTDDSVQTINQFRKHNNRIKYYSSEINSGNTFKQWNKGVSLAKGDLVWIAESDDFCDIDFIRRTIQPLLVDEFISVSYCQSHKMDEEDNITGSWSDYTADLDSFQFAEDFVMDGIQFIDKFLIKRNVIPNASGVLFRKSIFDKIGGADETLKTNSDWLTWLKMLCYGKVAYNHDHLNYFRYHSKSVIGMANSFKSEYQYSQQFDYDLRKKIIQFLKSNSIILPNKTLEYNNYLIQLDQGNRGLFVLGNGSFLYGWFLILKSSIFPKLQSGFIKKALRFI